MTGRRVGPARLLSALYLVFVVAAGSRSIVQLTTHAGRAPLAYALSLVAAVVYGLGLAAARRVHRGGGPGPLIACSCVELIGVLVVGTASLVDRAAFPDATVWSFFGAGYLFVPLALPVVVLLTVIRRSGIMAVWPAR